MIKPKCNPGCPSKTIAEKTAEKIAEDIQAEYTEITRNLFIKHLTPIIQTAIDEAVKIEIDKQVRKVLKGKESAEKRCRFCGYIYCCCAMEGGL